MKVMLVGPIKYWWDHWDSPEHKRYIRWRDAVSAALVSDGHLVYHPHAAWKGQWHESAQVVNDVAIRTCDVLLNLAPPHVYSFGTDDEIDYARRYNTTVLDAPLPTPGHGLETAAMILVSDLPNRVTVARDGDAGLRELATQLLWLLDAGTSQNSLSREEIISRARIELGVNTPAKATVTP